MSQQEWPMATSGRYSQLSRPIGVQRPVLDAASGVGGYTVGVHSQVLFFLLFAIMVGVGLLMIVPNLSAAADTVSQTSRPAQEPGADESVALPETQLQPDSPADALVTGQSSQTTIEAELSVSSGSLSPIFTREVLHWAPKILEWSGLYNLDPDIIATIMQIESCGDPGAASHAGAQGLFQVMPFHFSAGEDMLDPDTNAQRGMTFYNRQLEYTGWNIYLSFAGYNGGYAASGSSYPYWANETQRYYTWAKGIYDEAKAGQLESLTLQQWLQAGGGGLCQQAAQRLGI